ncbi:Ig-like domain-containing protein [Planomicrobium sp. CPCC 101110]|uniref:Ig-like domain-containing protein n=1 Tax=Planomicrobium sp. CPCC 101110 TaxID=2599619 RepID=UPI0011B7495F|nr:Ig-like domain-containing protein [Planomicrobium sp. CPCC 101110]TWT27737.1 hypothetical protein FQV30_04285 [Planomicrobium sp. CPCC 101110]
MKRLRVPLVVVIAMAIGFFVFRAFSEDKEVEGEASNIETETSKIDIKTSIETHTPLDKTFEFSFSEKLDESTMTKDIIKVLDEEQKEVAIRIALSDDKKTMKIQAPKDKYKKGSVYELQILEGIKYENGDPVKEIYHKEFITERDEVEKVELNEGLVFVEPEQVKAFGENEVTVEKSTKPDLAVGDIVIVPSKENPEGAALKVLELEEEKGTYQLIVEKPDFAELFNELDIYKTYEIKKEHIEIEEGIKGLTVTDFAGMNLNTMLAASNGTGWDFEFKTPEAPKGIESVKGIEFTFENMPLGKDKYSPLIDGSLSYQNAVTKTDMQLGKKTRYQLSMTSSSASKFVISPPAAEGKGGKTSKKIEKELKKTNEKIKLAKLKMPTAAPGVFVTGAFYLKVDYAFSYQPEITVVFEIDEERGVIYDGKTAKPINKFVPTLDASLKGTGTVETSAGAAASVSIEAFAVAGVGIEAFGGGGGTGEFHTGVNKEYGAYSCYKAAFNPILQGNLFVDFLGEEIYKGTLAKASLNPKIIKGNCDVFQKLEVKKKQVKLAAGETIQISIKGLYTDLGSGKSRTLDLKNSKSLKAVSADGKVAEASLENDRLVLTADDAPIKENTVVTIEYEEKGEAFDKPVVSKIELPIVIKGFKKIKEENLSEDESLAIAKTTIDKILRILNEAGEKHKLFNEVPGKYSLVESELSTLITDRFVEEQMRNYVEKEYYCECDTTLSPRIDDTMIRVNVKTIDSETFRVEGIFLANIMDYNSRKQILEFKKERTEWKMNDWFYELDNEDLKLLAEEVEASYAASHPNDVVKVTREYTNEFGQSAYIVEVNGSNIYSVDKRTGEVWLEGPPEGEEAEIEEEPSGKITPEEAELLVRQYLGTEQNTERSFIYDHDNELGDYVIHVYDVVKDDISSHNFTYGWYGVNPETGEVYNDLMRE